MSSDKPPSLVLLHLVTPHGARLAESLSRVAAQLPGLGDDAGAFTLDFSLERGLEVYFMPTRYSAVCRGRLRVSPDAFTRFDFAAPGVTQHSCVVRAKDLMSLGELGLAGSSAVLSMEVESDGLEVGLHGGTIATHLRRHVATIEEASAEPIEEEAEPDGVHLSPGDCPTLGTLLQKARGQGGVTVRLAAGADRCSLVCQVTKVSSAERALLTATLPAPKLLLRGQASEPVFRLEILLAYSRLLALGNTGLALRFDANQLRLQHRDAPFETCVWLASMEDEADSPMDAF